MSHGKHLMAPEPPLSERLTQALNDAVELYEAISNGPPQADFAIVRRVLGNLIVVVREQEFEHLRSSYPSPLRSPHLR